jgi:hypothetical protein
VLSPIRALYSTALIGHVYADFRNPALNDLEPYCEALGGFTSATISAAG